MALFQAGWNFVPLNSNLTVAEVAYILGDAGAKALVADERFAAVAAAARRRTSRGVPLRPARIAVGGAIPGLHPARRRPGRPPRLAAGGPGRRPVHAVHVGHDRAGPRRSQRTLPSFDPETWVQVFSGNLRATTSSRAATRCTW